MEVPAQVDAIIESATGDPVFIGLVIVLLLVVLFGYLFARRTLLSMREGYEDAYSEK